MKRRFIVGLLAMVLILLLAGCGCKHEWYAATCSAPKTCQLCGETEGEALPHTWQDATCTAAKTCTVCKATEGEALLHTWQDATCTAAKICTVCQTTEGDPLGHTWQDATCSTPKTCTVCQVTEGETADHTWQDATCTTPKTCTVCKATEGKTAAHKWQEATTESPKTCSNCKKTEGSKLKTDSRFTTKATKALQGTWTCDVVLTDEMMGLENFGNVDCRMTLKFGNTGKLSQSIKVKDEKSYMTKLKNYTVEQTYAAFAQQGLSREQADQAMKAECGLNVKDYVDAALKGYDINDMFKAFSIEEVYYVEGNAVFTAISWKAKFEKTEFTINNGKLVIDGLALEEGGQALVWKKA
jgi:hypothetical protein